MEKIKHNISIEANLVCTDDGALYRIGLPENAQKHGSVNHKAKEWVRGIMGSFHQEPTSALLKTDY